MDVLESQKKYRKLHVVKPCILIDQTKPTMLLTAINM